MMCPPFLNDIFYNTILFQDKPYKFISPASLRNLPSLTVSVHRHTEVKDTAYKRNHIKTKRNPLAKESCFQSCKLKDCKEK